jgi:hypothetical protein
MNVDLALRPDYVVEDCGHDLRSPGTRDQWPQHHEAVSFRGGQDERAGVSDLEVLWRVAVELLVHRVALRRTMAGAPRRAAWVALDVALHLCVREHRRNGREELVGVAVAQALVAGHFPRDEAPKITCADGVDRQRCDRVLLDVQPPALTVRRDGPWRELLLLDRGLHVDDPLCVPVSQQRRTIGHLPAVGVAEVGQLVLELADVLKLPGELQVPKPVVAVFQPADDARPA